MSTHHVSTTHQLIEELQQALHSTEAEETAAPLHQLDAAQAQALLEAACTLAARVDLQGRVLATIDATAKLLDYPKEYFLSATLADIVHSADKDALLSLLQHAALGKKPRSATLRFTRGLTESIWLHLHAVHDARAEPGDAHVLLFGYDVSKWIHAEAELRAEALLDPLTETGNRIQMRDEITQAIVQAHKNGDGFTVALLDLDSFKKINDSLGHNVGDELLYEVSQRLGSSLHDGDIVGRLGGDEFVIVLPHVHTAQAALDVASRLLLAIRAPFPLAGHLLHVTTSIGLAIYPQHGQSEAELLKHADLAMYHAKEHGKNRCSLYADELAHKQNKALSIELAMFEALQQGEFSLHYQPICQADTRQMVAVEALMRWQRADGPVSPEDFIPLAEENGLINLLGGWALRTVCMQLARWDELGIKLAYITVNVSPVQFHHASFPNTVCKAIEDSGISPERLVLEITEGALMKNPAKAEALLKELHALGVQFAVDDFGTGYSSLAYLKRFPLSTLKIDKSFIRDMANSQSDRAIVTAVLSLTLEMGLSVVAEGVETEEQRRFLLEKGCTYIQGWLICKALRPQDLESQIHAGRLVLQPPA